MFKDGESQLDTKHKAKLTTLLILYLPIFNN